MDDIIETSLSDDCGRPLSLRCLRATYDSNGAPAIVLWQCDEHGLLASEDEWCCATVNGVWPQDGSVVVLDSNNMPKVLVEDLLASGHVTDTGMRARSGYCSYPVCELDRAWYDGLLDYSVLDDEDAVCLFTPELRAEWDEEYGSDE